MATVMVSASARLKHKDDLPTLIAIGSPIGAMRSKAILSPGRHPISRNFKDNSSSVKESIWAISPTLSADNAILLKTV